MNTSLLYVSVPIKRDFNTNSRAIYVDYSNEKFGNESVCVSDDVLYKEGDTVPTTNVCERCTCQPPTFVCQDIKCEVKPGCKAVQRPNTCCPEYQCECEQDGKVYHNGERLDDVVSPCQACYCQSGEIVCTVIECYRRDDCEPRYVNGTCCPKYDHCPPLEQTSTTKQQDDLQENTIEQVESHEETLKDSPNLSSEPLQNEEDIEILEENMSEVHTQRTTVTVQDQPSTNTILQYDQLKTDKVTSSESAETEEATSAEISTLSTEETTEPADTVLGDTQPSLYNGEVQKFIIKEPILASYESSEETSQETSTRSKSEETTAVPKEENSQEISNESHDESVEDETVPTTEEYEIPVLNIKSDLSAENMSIVIPQPITSKTSYEEGSSFIHDDPDINGSSEEKFNSNDSKEDQKVNKDIENNSSEENNQSETLDDDTTSSDELKETPLLSALEIQTTKSSEDSFEAAEVTTTSQYSDDNTIKREIGIETTTEVTETTESDTITPAKTDYSYDSERESTSEITGAKISEDFLTTAPNIFESEHTENSRDYTSKTEDNTSSDELFSTTSSFLEDNLSSERKNSEFSSNTNSDEDEIFSTTPNVLEGEHPENRKSDLYEIPNSTSSDEVFSTTPNVLEGEHPENRKSDTYEIPDSTSSDEEISTTPSVLEDEHPGYRKNSEISGYTKSNEDDMLPITAEVLEGEHPENRRSDIYENDNSTNSDEVFSTTPNVLEGEEPNNRQNSEISENTNSDEVLSVTPSILEGEQSSERKSDTSEELSTTPSILEGEHPENRRSDISEVTTTSNYEEQSTTTVVYEGVQSDTKNTYISETIDNGSNDETESTTSNVLEGEHPESERNYETTHNSNNDEESTTLSLLESEHLENEESDSSKIASTTYSDETPTDILKGEQTVNSESIETSTGTSDDVPSTTPTFLDGERPSVKLTTLIEENSSRLSVSLSGESQVKEIVSEEVPETNDSTEVAEKSESSEEVISQPSEYTTSTQETTTYPTVYEITTINEEDNGVKILPVMNKTVAQDEDEGLPQKWLKVEQVIDETKFDDYEISKENIETESNSAETTTIKTVNTLAPENDEYNDSIYKSSEEEKKTSSEEVSITSTVMTTSAETEIPTEEVYQWKSEETSAADKYKRTSTLLSKEKQIEIEPIYEASYGSMGSNEQIFSTAEIYGDNNYDSAKESDKIGKSKEASTETEDLSTESTSTEVSLKSKEHSNINTQEIYSNEYIDSTETTTVLPNNTETTTNKNNTETTTPRSSGETNSNEEDASKKNYSTLETINSENEETYESSNVKEVNDFGSNFNPGDYFEDSGMVME
ncbi:hypothetical protein L9F63_011401 [Diploptera punctata]|uniref:VWFC domain-containing protein n=1 Tax=Diploptera punctata TaxID=6984 RepID=A0AAD8EPH2_DIPPU|nr:hypothetical protein L9F63_011401 [Diploptera punctata]